MSNLYHILDKIPPYEHEFMQAEYEDLAVQLVRSGKMRIDTEDKCNFVRFVEVASNHSKMFSDRELMRADLVEETKSYLREIYSRSLSGDRLENKVNNALAKMRRDLAKNQKISTEEITKIARLFVQSAHPIVIRWLLLEEVEIFISFSHNIGDMMDLQTWKIAGGNSGMQSTDGKNVAIFVSCGGDPFRETNKEYPTFGDGMPAMARLQIIAAQEIGHYADIKRDIYGRQISRHSADFMGSKASIHVKHARIKDIEITKQIRDKVTSSFLFRKMLEKEGRCQIFESNNVNNSSSKFNSIALSFYKIIYRLFAGNLGFTYQRFLDEPYFAMLIKAMFDDMLFNLAPKADVYRNNNKDIEEAIACIEALARVPQQVIKWGYIITSQLMPGLYKIYYSEVVPDLIKPYENITGIKYQRDFTLTKLSPWKHFLRKLKLIFIKQKSYRIVTSKM